MFYKFCFRLDSSLKSMLTYSLLQSSYFYTGSSNSLSSVDVRAGYIGLDDYWPILVGLLMLVNHYAGPLLVLCTLDHVVGVCVCVCVCVTV